MTVLDEVSVSAAGTVVQEVVVVVVDDGCEASTTLEAVDEVVSTAGALTHEVVFLVVVVVDGC